MNFLQSKLFAALLGGLLFLLTTAFLIPQGLGVPKPSAHGDEHADAPAPANTQGPSWQFFNPELEQIVTELKTERTSLTTREQQLGELEARLKAERTEIDEATRRIAKMQQEVNRETLRIKEDEVGNLKRLGKLYSTMEPSSAAKIMRELDDTVVVRILTLMKDAEVALILDGFAKMGEVEIKRAARLSENLRLAVGAKGSGK